MHCPSMSVLHCDQSRKQQRCGQGCPCTGTVLPNSKAAPLGRSGMVVMQRR